jgi:hypothetical protein
LTFCFAKVNGVGDENTVKYLIIHISKYIDITYVSFCEDEYLTRFGAMDWNVIENVTEMIITHGLDFAAGRSDDFTVVEPLQGLTWVVDWLDVTRNTCSFTG